MAFGKWLLSLRPRSRKHSAQRKSGFRRLLVESLTTSHTLRPHQTRGEILEDRRLLSVAPAMVEDIVPGADESAPWELANFNGAIFFAADNGVTGIELWTSDGTSGGTALFKDINPGGASSDSVPEQLTVVNGTLYFVADNGTNGMELWKSDGTSGGTAMVKDINSGSGDSSLLELTDVNGTLYFVADDGTNGMELWTSDGTESGTVMVQDIRSGAVGSSPEELTNVNGTLFFAANDGANGTELWMYDGTSASIVNINPTGDSDPAGLTNVNGTLFFAADDGTNGTEVWKCDTDGNAEIVKNIGPGGNGSDPAYLTDVNGTLFFTADDGVRGAELWKSNGTGAGTVVLKEFRRGSDTSDPANLTNVNGTLFLTADDGTHGDELWISDGTTVGTVMLKDVNSGAGDSYADSFTNVNGTLYFAAHDATNGMELWMSDGTAGHTVLAKDIYYGSLDSSPSELTAVGGKLFFAANDKQGTPPGPWSYHGMELWSAGAYSLPVLDVIPDPDPDTTLVYKAGQTAAAIAPAISLSDADSTILTGATIQISGNYQPGTDVLKFTNTSTIKGKWNATTGTMTLKGTDTLANYQAALRRVTFWRPTVLGERTMTFVAKVGSISSEPVTRDVFVANAPLLTMDPTQTSPLAYTENDGPTEIASLIAVSDVGSTNLVSATIQISKNYQNGQDVLSFIDTFPNISGAWNAVSGTLTLTGSDTVANYEAALQSVQYENTSESPSTAKRTVTFKVQDDTGEQIAALVPPLNPLEDPTALTSNVVSRVITVTSVNDAPVLDDIETSNLLYTEKDPAVAITSSITVNDVDNSNLTRATIQITGNYLRGQDRLTFTNMGAIRGSWNATTGTLTLSGSDTLANYQTAMTTVKYTTGLNPGDLDRTVTFQVSDGRALSNTQPRTIEVTPVNDAPVLSNIETAALAYRANRPATLITRSIKVSDVDNAELDHATVKITGGLKDGDELVFVDMGGISGSWDGIDTLTLSGADTVANYQRALRAVKFRGTTASLTPRTVMFTVNDGLADSNSLTRNINVTA